MSTRSQLSVATDDDVEDGFPADVVSEMQLSESQMRQMVGSLLLMFWKGVVHRAMARLAQYQMAEMMLMMMMMMMMMMFAAAVDMIIMKTVVVATAVAVSVVASVVVVAPENLLSEEPLSLIALLPC